MAKMLSKSLVRRMYRDYSAGVSLGGVGRKYNRDRRSISEIFTKRGLKLRPVLYTIIRGKHGQIAPLRTKTEKEIDGLISQAVSEGKRRRAHGLRIPKPLRHEWRGWLMERKRAFIARLRARLNLASDRPMTPFSKNLEPFDYGSPRAVVLAAKLNEAIPSRYWTTRIFPHSQGVIWEGQLFFWCAKSGGYFVGRWKPGIGRPSLHHIIWEKSNGRPVPSAHTVICKDGNKNNLDPSNLALRSMADCARQNMLGARIRKSREGTSALLKRFERNKRNEHHDHDGFEKLRERASATSHPCASED